jgi:hypothetical protein
VTLYLSARSSDGTSLGRIPVVDRDSVAVDLILDNNLAGSVRTVAGSYQFTGLGSGFYRAVARVVGTVADTAWISRHEPGGATVDTLELGHTGDLEMVPNPVVSGGSITFTLQAATTATATLKIVTVGGSVVRTLLNQSMEPGAHQVTWDGLDDHGQTVAAGVYWLLFNRDSDYRADLIRKL